MRAIAISTAMAVMLMGCSSEKDDGSNAGQASSGERTVAIVGNDGSQLGTVLLQEEPSGVMLSLEVAGMEPGMSAVHLHEKGDCSASDFTSAGGHWNPEGNQHGRDNPQGAHLGDLANIVIGEDGSGESRYLLAGASLSGNPPMIDDADGTALVIHAGPDDYQTDPAGDAGARVACAVVSAES